MPELEISKIKLENVVHNIKDASARAAIATEYNPASTYHKGDYAFMAGTLYTCLQNDVTGEWYPPAWQETSVTAELSGKQEKLVSGTNIKTINNNSLLGAGNITIQEGAQSDYNQNNNSLIDYIKNRPFYDTRQSSQITLDIPRQDPVYVADELQVFKCIVPAYPTKGQPFTLTVTIDGVTTTLQSSDMEQMQLSDNADAFLTTGENLFEVILAYNAQGITDITSTLPVELPPMAAVLYGDMLGTSHTVTMSITYTAITGELKQIDEKFIPSIQSNYNINDSTSPYYIKNRPFYDNTPRIIKSETAEADIANPDYSEEGFKMWGLSLEGFPMSGENFTFTYAPTGGTSIVINQDSEYADEEGYREYYYETGTQLFDVFVFYTVTEDLSQFISGYGLNSDTKVVVMLESEASETGNITFETTTSRYDFEDTNTKDLSNPTYSTEDVLVYDLNVGSTLCGYDDYWEVALNATVEGSPFSFVANSTQEYFTKTEDIGTFNLFNSFVIKFAYTSDGWDELNEEYGLSDLGINGTPFVVLSDLTGATGTLTYNAVPSELKKMDPKFLPDLKTINGESIIGTGDIEVSGTTTWGSITGTLSNQTDLNTALTGKQETLVSGTNIKTVNNQSLLGSGNIEISAGVQSDYEQNDSSADDYIKNRPIYDNRYQPLNYSNFDTYAHAWGSSPIKEIPLAGYVGSSDTFTMTVNITGVGQVTVTKADAYSESQYYSAWKRFSEETWDYVQVYIPQSAEGQVNIAKNNNAYIPTTQGPCALLSFSGSSSTTGTVILDYSVGGTSQTQIVSSLDNTPSPANTVLVWDTFKALRAPVDTDTFTFTINITGESSIILNESTKSIDPTWPGVAIYGRNSSTSMFGAIVVYGDEYLDNANNFIHNNISSAYSLTDCKTMLIFRSDINYWSSLTGTISFATSQGDGTLKRLDTKYLPDLKTINGQSIVGSGDITVSGVQSDYNQNDSTAADYIKNKPFYDSTTTVTETLSIIRSSDTKVAEGSGYTYYKAAPSRYQSLSAPFVLNLNLEGNTVTINSSDMTRTTSYEAYHIIMYSFTYSAHEFGLFIADTAEGVANLSELLGLETPLAANESIIYGDTYEMSRLVAVQYVCTTSTGELKKIDQKFIDTDYNQNDSTAVNYIKNRPVYDTRDIVTTDYATPLSIAGNSGYWTFATNNFVKTTDAFKVTLTKIGSDPVIFNSADLTWTTDTTNHYRYGNLTGSPFIEVYAPYDQTGYDYLKARLLPALPAEAKVIICSNYTSGDTGTWEFNNLSGVLQKLDAKYLPDSLITAIENKQDELVSGTNIKTVNGESILINSSANDSTNIEIPQLTAVASLPTADESEYNKHLEYLYNKKEHYIVKGDTPSLSINAITSSNVSVSSSIGYGVSKGLLDGNNIYFINYSSKTLKIYNILTNTITSYNFTFNSGNINGYEVYKINDIIHFYVYSQTGFEPSTLSISFYKFENNTIIKENDSTISQGSSKNSQGTCIYNNYFYQFGGSFSAKRLTKINLTDYTMTTRSSALYADFYNGWCHVYGNKIYAISNSRKTLQIYNCETELPESITVDLSSIMTEDNNEVHFFNGTNGFYFYVDYSTKVYFFNAINNTVSTALSLSQAYTTFGVADTYLINPYLINIGSPNKLYQFVSTYQYDYKTNTTTDDLVTKQDTLVSGTNIKTINGSSILGSGDLTISGSTSIITADFNATVAYPAYSFIIYNGNLYYNTEAVSAHAWDASEWTQCTIIQAISVLINKSITSTIEGEY